MRRLVADWSIIGVPIDCSASERGEQLAPTALRKAGIVEALAADDRGDLPVKVDDAHRDEQSGVIAYRQIVEANIRARDAVRNAAESGSRPLVLGGDCSLLPGALAGVSAGGGALGLCLVDGHVDAHDGDTSRTGEAADMPLAVALGRGAREWVGVGERTPILAPEDVVVLGHRTDPDDLAEIALVPPAVTRFPATEILASEPEPIGEWAAGRLAGRPRGFWLHFDTDVLDESELPASTYRAKGGLHWDHLDKLLRPLLTSPALAGLSIADFRPDLDPHGHYARRIVAYFAGELGG
jgi:arginase